MRIGSLFSGAGGLDRAVQAVFGGDIVWHSEIDKAASKVLAYRFPGVPNLGDITKVDWAAVEPVDIICGGWPCQPFSLAGKQKGIHDERALWPHVAGAVRVLRPRYVVLENVSAVLTAGEFDRVASDLAACGYDIRWTCARASDVSAPHRRERLFILAHSEGARWGVRDTEDIGQTYREVDAFADDCGSVAISGDEPGVALLPTLRRQEGDRIPGGDCDLLGGSNPMLPNLLPAPTSRDHKGGNQRGDETCLHGALLPTPNAQDGNGGGRHSSAGHQSTLPGEVRLLPTPRTSDTNGAGHHGDGGMDLRTTVSLLPTPRVRHGDSSASGLRRNSPGIEAVTHHFPGAQWGKYAPAIARWESIVGPAPAPTEPNKNGNPRLSAAFSEWLMGWPAGWVTDPAIGISRNDQLRIVGNGVVSRCAEVAIRYLLQVAEVSA